MKKLSFVVYGLLCMWSIQAQNQNCLLQLKGTITDSVVLTALPDALVRIEKLNLETKADSNGQFIFTNLCPGQYEIHLSHFNCEHKHILINLQKDSVVHWVLNHQEKELQNHYVILKIQGKGSINSLNYKDLEVRRGLPIGQMMQDIVGVSLLNTGSSISKPMVNGLFGNRLVLVNNGIRQEGQNWGMDHAPEIDGFLANEIELMKGAEALRYGSDGIAGVILIKPKSIFNESYKLMSAELGLLGNSNGRGKNAFVSFGKQISKKFPLVFRVQGSIKALGNFQTPGYYIANTGIKERNSAVQLGYRKGKIKTEFFYSYFSTQIGLYTGAQVGNLSDLEQAMNSDKPLVDARFTYHIQRPYQQVSHQILKYQFSYQVNLKNHIEILAAVQKNHREEYDVLRSNSAYLGPAFDYYISSKTIEALWSKNQFHGINWKAGVFGLHQSNAYTGRYFIPGFYHQNAAAFVMGDKKFKKFNVEGSLRFDEKALKIYQWTGNVLNLKHLNYHGLAAIGVIDYQLKNHQNIRFKQSYNWRAPSANELYANGLHQGLASIEIGDSTLKTERSLGTSIQYQLKHYQWQLEAEIYGQKIMGYINLEPANYTLLTIRGAYPVFKYTQTDALLYGINARIKTRLSDHWLHILSIQMPYGQSISRHSYLNLMPAMNTKMQVQYNKNKVSSSVQLEYQAKQKRYVVGSDYLAPPSAYLLLGFDFLYEMDIKNQNIKFGLTASNIGNQKYRSYLNRFRYFIDEPARNIQVKIIFKINQHKSHVKNNSKTQH